MNISLLDKPFWFAKILVAMEMKILIKGSG
jgi:hypothetical protein